MGWRREEIGLARVYLLETNMVIDLVWGGVVRRQTEVALILVSRASLNVPCRRPLLIHALPPSVHQR